MTAIRKHSIPTIQNKSRIPAQKRSSDAKLAAALKALRGSAPSNNLNIATQVTPLKWILEDTSYTHWRDDSNSQILWVSGSPGTGKAKAALSIVRDLGRLTPGLSSRGSLNKSPIVAYHFDDGRNKAVEAINVLQSLVYTLLEKNPLLISHFVVEKQDTRKPKFEGLTQLGQILKKALSDSMLGTVYFVCSGLDQIKPSSRRELLDIFTSWTAIGSHNIGHAYPVIKILVLSAPSTDIETALRSTSRIDLEDAGNASVRETDLRAFATERIQEISTRKSWNRALRYYANGKILPQKQLESSYDWFELVFAELDSVSEQEYSVLRERLRSLPAGMAPMYDRIVKRISSDRDSECIKEILRCLLVAHRALTLREIAVVADLPGNRSDEENIKTTILKCGGFVELFSDGGDGSLKVRLRSRAIWDYLRSVSEVWLFMDSEEMQHGIVALRCFEYVRVMGSNSVDDRTLLDYPCTNWVKHAMQAAPDVVENFDLEKNFWKPRSEERREWATIYSKYDTDFDAKFTALDFAAYFGYLPLVRELLRHEQHQNELRNGASPGSQSLHLACKNGFLEVARFLVQSGANVNSQDGKRGSPLHAAVSAGSRIELIDFLLQHGANVNAVDPSIGSVLCVATRSGDAPAMKRLIEKGADVNLRGGRYETALQVAAYIGGTDKFKILLDMGADPTARGGYYGSALSAAAAAGHIEITNISLSLKQKPTPEMTTEALYTAVHYRQTYSVELLLSKGADVTAKGLNASPLLARYDSILSALEDPLSKGEIAQANYEDGIEKTIIMNDNDEDNLSDPDDCSVYSNDLDEMEDAENDDSYEKIKSLITVALEALKPMPIHIEKPMTQYKPYQDLYAINDDFSPNSLISPYFQPEPQTPEQKKQRFHLTRPDLRGTTPGPELQQSRLTRPVIPDRASSAPGSSLQSGRHSTEEYASQYRGRQGIQGTSKEVESATLLTSKAPQQAPPHKREASPKFDFFKNKNAGLPFRDLNVPAGLSILDSSKLAARPKPNEMTFYDHHLARISGSPRKLDDIPVAAPVGVTARPRGHAASKSETLPTSTSYPEKEAEVTSVKPKENYTTGVETPISQSAGLITKSRGHAASISETPPTPAYPEVELTVAPLAPLRPAKVANIDNSHPPSSAKPPTIAHQYKPYDGRSIAPQSAALPAQDFTSGGYGQHLLQASQKEGEYRAQPYNSGAYGEYSPYSQDNVIETGPISKPIVNNQSQSQPSQNVYNSPAYPGSEIGPYTSQDLRPSRRSPDHTPRKSPGPSPGQSPNIRSEIPAGRPRAHSLAQSQGRAPTEIQDTTAYSLAYAPSSFSNTPYPDYDLNSQPYPLSPPYTPPTTTSIQALPSYRGVIGTTPQVPQTQQQQQYRTRKNSQTFDERAQVQPQYRQQQPYQTHQGQHQQQGQYRTQAPHQGYTYPDQRG